jgi:uncharacterized protein
MEHESFEDDYVAELMNKTFISIKVDREERPDIDNIYMTVCQTMTGAGGWPLTILITPDKKPFFAGTYIPKQNNYGRLGMIELINKVDDLWRNDYNSIINSAEEITAMLQESNKKEQGGSISLKILDEAFRQLKSTFDIRYGGFGTAPKFPSPHNMLFLLRYYIRTKNVDALNMVQKTLDSMSFGGIFDQIGYGFHRYSTDRMWILPHFEKMLYDQAMISLVYIEAYQLTNINKYKHMAERIFEYIINDMKSNEGAFYSAEDADSEGEEGKFYLWSVDEIKTILDKADVELAMKAFGMKNEGNFKHEIADESFGLNILHFEKSIANLSSELNMPISQLEGQLEHIRTKLIQVRKKRIRPLRDDKILTDWNGLMIAALAKAGAVFNNESYIKFAATAADFFLNSIGKNGRLLHRYRNGEWNFYANIDDYSFLIFGLIELYEANFETRYLMKAISLSEELIKLFWDEIDGGFYFTPKDGEEIIVRTKEIYDGAIPSGNSISLLNLLRLSRISGNLKLGEYADKLQTAFSNTVKDNPLGHTQMLANIDYLLGTSYEIVVSGNKDAKDTKEMISELNKRFIPNKVVILNPVDEHDSDILNIAPYTKDQKAIDGKATAFVCKNFSCGTPTTSITEMLKSFEL